MSKLFETYHLYFRSSISLFISPLVYSYAFLSRIGVVIQGENEEELPEVVLAACTIKRIDFTAALDFED